MNVYRAIASAAVLLLAVSNQVQARPVSVLTYQEMFAKSDLVVIANPTTKTTDTGERGFFPNLWKQENDGKRSKVESVGVETSFSVSAVLKGNANLKEFTLHHYRAVTMNFVNGPVLVSFDPAEGSGPRSYLLFLVRESDGRFAPVDGQTDPGIYAIIPIPFQAH